MYTKLSSVVKTVSNLSTVVPYQLNMERIVGEVLTQQPLLREDRHAIAICFFFFSLTSEMNKGAGWEGRHKKIIREIKEKTSEKSVEFYQKFFHHFKMAAVSYHYDYNYHSVHDFDLRVNFSLLITCGRCIYIVRHEKYVKEIYLYAGFLEPIQIIYCDNKELNMNNRIDYDYLSYIL